MKGVKIDATSALIGVLGGAVAGGLVGYLAGRELARRGEEARISAEAQSIREYYRDKAELELARADSDAAERPATTVGASGVELRELVLDPQGSGMPGTGIISVSGDPGDRDERDEAGPGGPENSRRAFLERTVPEIPDKTKPYIISHDEYFEDESDYRRISLTWYAADSVLVDDREVPIREHVKTCGDFMNRFGEQSGDPSIVFIRNEKLERDFEITLNRGSYAEQVLGYGKPQ